MACIIITDSTAYLSEEYLHHSLVTTIPLTVQLDNLIFKEGLELGNAEYYQLLRNSTSFPLTSQPASGEFLQVYRTLGPNDEAVVILISSELSGTPQSALMAVEMMDHPRIQVIDSSFTVAALAFQVTRAVDMAAQGAGSAEIIPELNRIRNKTKVFFVVDNLEYLFRGGRISKMGQHLGNILKLKPILHLSHGKIELFEKVRTKNKAIQRMLQELTSVIDQVEKVAIMHVDNEYEAKLLETQIRDFFAGPLSIEPVGPVIGSHVGPGTLGIGFY